MASREQSPTGASERTPLLPRDEESVEATNTKKTTRWPSFVALGALCIAIVLAIVFGFAAPAIVEEYAKEAITFEPSNLSIDSFTDYGIEARVQGRFYLDSSKVHKKSVRDIGRAVTWIAKEVESGDMMVDIYLPEYGDSRLGTVMIPPVKLNIRNGHDNFLDIVAAVQPGDVEGIRQLAQDVMSGKQSLDVKATAKVAVKSGLISLGTQTITQYMTLQRPGDTKLPEPDISNLKVKEYGKPGHPQGIISTADVTVLNKYPVKFDVPPLAFEIMLKDCSSTPLVLGTVQTGVLHILPKQNVTVAVAGFAQQLPTPLTEVCSESAKSPLDAFIGAYLAGKDAKLYVKGGKQDDERTPAWIGKILKGMVLPIDVPSHPLNNDMMKDFSLSDVSFSLPDRGEDSKPQLSATINVVVGLSKDIDIEVKVDRIRADSEVSFKGRKMGRLDLLEWQTATSTKIGDELHVKSVVKDAPLTITDQEVFSEVIQDMMFGGKGISLDVHADVDVDSATALGKFVVREIPADGNIFIKPIGGQVNQTVKDISVVGSSKKELIMQAVVEVENPTEYSAHIPYVNVSVWCNETQLGYGWGSFDMGPGMNEFVVKASYAGGPVGAELLSQYISGWNTSLTIKTHDGSLPGLPDPKLSVTVPMPHLFGKFMKETTMHVLSSTTSFILFSPLPMTIMNISAAAYYEGKDIGTIYWDEPFDVVVGDNETPRLPVDWNTDGGLKMIRDALGGTLKLDAHADVGVKIGKWRQTIWYEAKGMGAKIRLL